jgi:hypothetical protein
MNVNYYSLCRIAVTDVLLPVTSFVVCLPVRIFKEVICCCCCCPCKLKKSIEYAKEKKNREQFDEVRLRVWQLFNGVNETKQVTYESEESPPSSPIHTKTPPIPIPKRARNESFDEEFFPII